MSNQIIKWMTIIVLLVAMWQSGAIAMASIYTLRGERAVIESTGMDPRYEQAKRLFGQARKVDARHPIPLANAVRLTKISRLSDDDEKQESLALHQRLVSIRPASAENWARLFAIKSILGERDVEWQYSLAQAVSVGPFEPLALHHLMDAGTRHWLGLTPAMRESMLDAAVRVLISASTYHERDIVDLLQTRGFLPLVCLRIRRQGEQSRHCPVAVSG